MNFIIAIRKISLISGFIFFLLISYGQPDNEGGLNVKGHVYDISSKKGLEGINVFIPGYSSAYTDSMGNFSINVPHYHANLHFESQGHQFKIIALSGSGDIAVFLYEKDYTSLYRQADFYYNQIPLLYTTGAVSVYNTNDNAWKRPGCSAEDIFEGEIAGLNAISRSGINGIGSNMFIRGYSSLYASSQPLIFVDGYLYDIGQYGNQVINGYLTNPFVNIDIENIENVTVIKDAASIYGAKGANGVILISTSHASELATKIDFTAYGGINQAPKQFPMLNSYDYREYIGEIYESVNYPVELIETFPFMIDDPAYADYYRYHNDYNWQDEVFTDSKNQNYKLKIKGGDEVALYALSVGYQNMEGIVKNTGFSKYAFRFNSDIKFSPKITLNSNIGLTYTENNLKDDGYDIVGNPIYTALVKAPFLYPYNITEFGTITPNLEESDIFNISNPVSIIENVMGKSKNYRVFGSLNGNYKIKDGIVLSNLLGVNYDKISENIFRPDLGLKPEILDLDIARNSVTQKIERYFSFYNDLRVSWSFNFQNKHEFLSVTGNRINSNQTEGDWAKDYNTPNDEIRSLGNGDLQLKKVGGYIGQWNTVTYYEQVSYNYLKKYFVTAGISLDGSSRFGDHANGISLFSNVFGFFPSISAAWLASSETFLNKVDLIDILKIRASYGKTGNDNIGNYNAQRLYISQNLIGAEGIINKGIYNPELQWETCLKANIGIDLAVFKERVSFSLDFYKNITKDMFNLLFLENSYSGYDYYYANNGGFETKGLDFTLNSRILAGKFKWDLGVVLSKYKTEVTEFPGDERISTFWGANILTKTGQPLGVFYGYKTKGVFATEEEAENSNLRAKMANTSEIPFSAGDIIFNDKDGNLVIDENDMDIIGDPNPDLTGTIINKFSFKGIVLDAALSFCYGNDIYNFQRYLLESMKDFNNQTQVVLNRWKHDGQVTDVPKAVYGDPMGNARFSDRWIEDGSYARIKYVTLSYDIPVKSKIVNGIQVFVSGRNLLTLTNYLGIDPEFSVSGMPLEQGIDIGLTPQFKSFFAGIKLAL